METDEWGLPTPPPTPPHDTDEDRDLGYPIKNLIPCSPSDLNFLVRGNNTDSSQLF